MKYLILCFITIVLISCSSNTNNSEVSNAKVEVETSGSQISSGKFEFIDTKTEQQGDNINTMEHYTAIGQFDLNALKILCADRKSNFNGFFLYIVIFDDKKNASFPTDPFTAAYGMEEKKMKHIKAFYTYNAVNGYSKLATYENNMYESAAEEVDI